MSDDLQFDRAEFATTTPLAACGGCQAVLTDSYYQANTHILCGSCVEGLDKTLTGNGSSRFIRVLRAVALGFGAALAGATIHFLVLHFLEINAALVTILMGWMVGKAVRTGSGGRGGWRYQLLAVLLTYLAIAIAYVPLAIEEIRKGPAAEAAAVATGKTAPVSADAANPEKTSSPEEIANGTTEPVIQPPPSVVLDESRIPPLKPTGGLIALVLGAAIAMVFSLPILVGIEHPLSLLIFGFGLLQAWKVNKRAEVEITGPHALLDQKLAPASAVSA